MQSLQYYWNKLLKKVRGRAVADSHIDKTSKIEAGSSIVGVHMGRHSFCGYDCTILSCKIGAFCSIANRVSIGLPSHPMEWVSTSPAFLERKDSIKMKYAKHPYEITQEIVIGNDVWIGEGVFIKSGVKIGDGAVIGMGSVVTKDVPDYAIVAGVPAKIIRMRFEEDQILKLQKLKWWDWEDEKLFQYGPLFNDVEAFLEKAMQEYQEQ
ncbi:MAG: CatB-related O-acetyltransferase [Lachnospiraceae bacterium]|nr:CatB-related O-acetyltransferase [Lachnospiraceae bacterium]